MNSELKGQKNAPELNNLDTVVIIPAYNEEDSIGLVLDAIPKTRIIEVIVVNNNSSDKTEQVAKSHGAHVIFEKQQGYGKACLTGIERALTLSPENIIFLDGDFSDSPEEIKLLIEQLDQEVELVIGSRNLGKAQKGALLPQAIFGNWLATTLLSILFPGKTKFTDLGPFRGIKTSSLKEINMKDEDFGWTVEMQVKALIHNLKCSEVSVSYKSRIGISKITGTIKGTFMAGYKILYTIFKYRILK